MTDIALPTNSPASLRTMAGIEARRLTRHPAFVIGVVLAFATFGAGMLLRHRPVPAWLSWVGAVSYSVYLLHYVVIYLTSGWTMPLIEAAWWQRSLAAAGYLTILLVASYLCYRFVEMPFQSLGRRVVKRVAQRA